MICKTDLTDELRDAITQLGKEHSIYNGLHEGIGAFKEILALMPDSLETSMFGDVSIESISLIPALMISQVHQQANEMLRLYIHVLACNYANLTEGLFRGLNESNYPAAILMTRALLEHTAVADIRISQIRKHCDALKKWTPSNVRKSAKNKNDQLGFQAFSDAFDFMELLNYCYGAGRFNRDALIDHRNLLEIEIPKNDPLRQVGVMDAIKELNWTGPLIPAKNASYYYHLLCDYVHPNVGANIVFVDIEEIRDCVIQGARKGNRVIRRISRIFPKDISLRLHTLQVIYLPLRESVVKATMQLNELSSIQTQRDRFTQGLRDIGLIPLLPQRNVPKDSNGLCNQTH